MSLQVTPDLAIDDRELEERFVRASGPGGQNVNKVATAVQLRFDVARSASLSEEVRDRLRALAGHRMTTDGYLVVEASAHRTQSQNRGDARERLARLIRRALVAPKHRHKTKPTQASRQRRLESKRRRSAAKQRRGKVSADD